MPDLITNPLTWVLFCGLTLTAIVFGRIRREPAWAIALTAVGASAALIGLIWSSELGSETLGPVALVGIGMSIWTMAVERTRARRSAVAPSG